MAHPIRPARRAVALAAVVVLGAGALSACGANEAQNSAEDAKTIALLLPESKTTRYEAFDKPLFEAKVAELCEDCEVSYYNADQDEAKQAQQVDSAINEGAAVIVLDPVNGAGAGGMVTSAQDADIPVIAYDRFIADADLDYYVSFDSRRIGRLQGEALVRELAVGRTGPAEPPQGVLLVNGSPTDPNSAALEAGVADAFADGASPTPPTGSGMETAYVVVLVALSAACLAGLTWRYRRLAGR